MAGELVVIDKPVKTGFLNRVLGFAPGGEIFNSILKTIQDLTAKDVRSEFYGQGLTVDDDSLFYKRETLYPRGKPPAMFRGVDIVRAPGSYTARELATKSALIIGSALLLGMVLSFAIDRAKSRSSCARKMRRAVAECATAIAAYSANYKGGYDAGIRFSINGRGRGGSVPKPDTDRSFRIGVFSEVDYAFKLEQRGFGSSSRPMQRAYKKMAAKYGKRLGVRLTTIHRDKAGGGGYKAKKPYFLPMIEFTCYPEDTGDKWSNRVKRVFKPTTHGGGKHSVRGHDR